MKLTTILKYNSSKYQPLHIAMKITMALFKQHCQYDRLWTFVWHSIVFYKSTSHCFTKINYFQTEDLKKLTFHLTRESKSLGVNIMGGYMASNFYLFLNHTRDSQGCITTSYILNLVEKLVFEIIIW